MKERKWNIAHPAASIMYEALINAVDDLNIDGTYTVEELMETIARVRQDMQNAITKAEGD